MGNFTTPQIINTAAKDADVYVADLDGDSDLDVLTVFSDKIAWHKNLLINNTAPAPKFYLHITPNPTQNTATLTYTATQTQPATLHLYDLTGRLLFETTLQPTAGINSYVLDMTRYPQGIYVLTLNNGAEVVAGKVVRK